MRPSPNVITPAMPETWTFRIDRGFYAAEKFCEAAAELAKTSEPVRSRIFEAMMHLRRIDPRDLMDGKMWEELVAIREELIKAKPVGDEGAIKATLQEMSDGEVEAMAARLSELCRRGSTLLPDGADGSETPLP